MTTVPEREADSLYVRRATQSDLLSVSRIERAVFSQPWTFSVFERFLGEAGFLVAVRPEPDDRDEHRNDRGNSDRVGDDGEDVLGYVIADVTPNFGRDIGHVKDLAVRPDVQGGGVGRRLLGRALVSLLVQGATVAKLEVRPSNEAAVSLYRSEGFEPARRVPRYYADGEDALVMLLDLENWKTTAEFTGNNSQLK
ncbi:ribosomal protein alanine N-acetyltransferase [Halalkaliarchaeum desulfuricum]|uniref:Ribosomal protein alanine N-acetyltransferase n=1 Tax=Halalkaliarchaeum desulfuricum TaxID=2055893 RepID=A0A343THR1_9EURY|nr:GNAT family N-acetyltransferase [Halalkaliarchaeum desulfuricum]AUX08633.1 ribosomal protein alanine N-acetyltransferase [Halalkaliarchaeum desulfuricum]